MTANEIENREYRYVADSKKEVVILPLFRQRYISREKILSSSDSDFLKLQISSTDIPAHSSPLVTRSIRLTRSIIRTAMSDEALLRKFLGARNNSSFDFILHSLNLTNDIMEKAGIDLNSNEQSNLHYSIFDQDRTIQLYFKNSQRTNIYDALHDYSSAYFQTKHLVESAERAKEITQEIVPSLYKDIPLLVSYTHTPKHNGASYDAVKRLLNISGSESLQNDYDYTNRETTGPWCEKYKFRRRLYDLLVMVHEYAHAVYTENVGAELAHLRNQKTYYSSADAALNEGFAVMVEMLSINKLIRHSGAYGLDQRDTRDLLEFKKQRLRALHRAFIVDREHKARKVYNYSNDIAYTQGTLSFMHKIYKAQGIQGIEDFVWDLDPHKTLGINRLSRDYGMALRNPKLLPKIFGKQKQKH